MKTLKMISAFLFFAVVGFTAGLITTQQNLVTVSAETAEFSSMGNLNDPTVYPCPSSQAEFDKYLTEIKFIDKLKLNCNDKTTSRLGRVLKFLADAKPNLPAKWSYARDALIDPLGYVNKQARSVHL